MSIDGKCARANRMNFNLDFSVKNVARYSIQSYRSFTSELNLMVTDEKPRVEENLNLPFRNRAEGFRATMSILKILKQNVFVANKYRCRYTVSCVRFLHFRAHKKNLTSSFIILGAFSKLFPSPNTKIFAHEN